MKRQFLSKFYRIAVRFSFAASMLFPMLRADGGVIENLQKSCDSQRSEWNGFDRFDFKLDSISAIVVAPKNPRPDKAWILRPAFFGAFANADAKLAERGFFIVYYDLTHRYASPKAMELADGFYNFAVETLGLNSKVALEGLSRGGACALNWANKDPSKIACVYVDAPVCDFSIWPSAARAELFGELKREWGIENLEGFKGNPIDNFENLARSGVPVLMISGDSDKTVPYEKNGGVYAKRFFDAGGSIRTIIKKGADHHPHGLDDPSEIVEFVERAYESSANSNRTDSKYRSFNKINFRAPMSESRTKFESGRGRVAFLGGSITEMDGWRNAVCADLQRRFPDTRFEFISAGISSLGTTPHAFRMSEDIPELKNIDLLFVEGAVNDHTNGFSDTAQIRAMEGIVRRTLVENPNADIVMLHFIWDGFLDDANAEKTPKVIENHERVSVAYGINSIDLCAEISARMRAGQFDWQKFGGTHPSPFGHKFYSNAVANLLDKAFDANAEVRARSLPAPIDESSYWNGKFVSPQAAKIKSGWKIEEPWKPTTKCRVRERFKNLPVLETLEAGAELEFEFKGNAVGIYCLSGKDAGILEYSIDGKDFKSLDTFTPWSSQLYIPWLFILEDRLNDANHKVVIKMSEKRNPESGGNACQILKFAVNGK